MLPPEGTHQAKLNGQIVVHKAASSDAICCTVPVQLIGSETAWTGKTTQTIVKSDDTVQDKTMKNLTRIFGDPLAGLPVYRFAEDHETALAEIPGASEILFEIVGEHKTIQPTDGGEEYLAFSIKWLNPLGGGLPMPEPISRKDILSKYGSKFRALGYGKAAGGTAAAQATPAKAEPAQAELPTAAAAKSKPAAAPAKFKGPPAKAKPAAASAPAATMDEAWAAMQESNKGMGEKELGEKFYADIMAVAKTDIVSDVSDAQWGELKAKWESGS